jgi:hypothetical protein
MKYAAILLTLVFATVAFAQADPAAGGTAGEPKAEKKAAKAKEGRVQGHIVRINKDKSTMSIRGGRSSKDTFEREISYDSSTQWTKLGKPAQPDEFKEGSFVIAVGKPDEKGNFHANRIDLRLPR